MNLVERVARMIDAEGAYSVGYSSTSPTAQPVPPTDRQLYFRARYEYLAIEILKFLMNTSHDEIVVDLIEFEKRGWRLLGVPTDDPKFKDLVDRIIREKYQ